MATNLPTKKKSRAEIEALRSYQPAPPVPSVALAARKAPLWLLVFSYALVIGIFYLPGIIVYNLPLLILFICSAYGESKKHSWVLMVVYVVLMFAAAVYNKMNG